VLQHQLTYTSLHYLSLSLTAGKVRPTVPDWEVILRLCLAVVVGSVIGLEREFTAHAAGLRTHILVSLGAALFTLAGVVVEGADPTRVAAQVVSGIGFLGAGAVRTPVA
jgi:uncharacterized membrane protein YhiD involved in acid resistance